MHSILGRRERWFLWITAIIITLASWAVGCMWLRTQWILLGLSALGVAVAFLPMPAVYFESTPPRPADNMRKLLKFPLFWIGLALLAYISVQAMNARVEIVFENGRFESNALPYLENWPSSVLGPMGTSVLPNGRNVYGMNAWRILLILSTPFLIAMGLWLNVRHRKTLRALGWVLMINASAMALYGVFAFLHPSSDHTILGGIHVENGRPFGSFDYPNHAAAFMNLALGATLALALESMHRTRRLGKSSPMPFFMLCAFILSTD
ncbi:MAG: hypothetical protein B7X06_00305 [Verrucomicrobia bacterium 21-51-4]|nr:MAG: hypothetical protein B7X06_00305 [Verrucomicrobia bacterium 21-51-4]